MREEMDGCNYFASIVIVELFTSSETWIAEKLHEHRQMFKKTSNKTTKDTKQESS